MRLILKPLFEVELPPEFVDILKAKIKGKEVKEGEIVEIDLLGKPLKFEVIYAEPKELKVKEDTKIEISCGESLIIDFEFEESVRDVIPFEKGFVLVFENRILILNHKGQKIYSDEFEKLNKVRVSKDTVVVVHDKNKVRIIKP